MRKKSLGPLGPAYQFSLCQLLSCHRTEHVNFAVDTKVPGKRTEVVKTVSIFFSFFHFKVFIVSVKV